jgi:hypothetical protein
VPLRLRSLFRRDGLIGSWMMRCVSHRAPDGRIRCPGPSGLEAHYATLRPMDGLSPGKSRMRPEPPIRSRVFSGLASTVENTIPFTLFWPMGNLLGGRDYPMEMQARADSRAGEEKYGELANHAA